MDKTRQIRAHYLGYPREIVAEKQKLQKKLANYEKIANFKREDFN